MSPQLLSRTHRFVTIIFDLKLMMDITHEQFFEQLSKKLRIIQFNFASHSHRKLRLK
jgi:hypothetical protein